MRRIISAAMAALVFVAGAPAAFPQGTRPPPRHDYWQGRGAPPPGHEVRPPPRDERWEDRRTPPPGWNGDSWRRRQDWLRRHGHNDHDNNNSAGLIVGTILGFVLGAAIADSREQQVNAESRLNDPAWIAYCARRYRSFDPYSGTYLGNDGLRHYCR